MSELNSGEDCTHCSCPIEHSQFPNCDNCLHDEWLRSRKLRIVTIPLPTVPLNVCLIRIHTPVMQCVRELSLLVHVHFERCQIKSAERSNEERPVFSLVPEIGHQDVMVYVIHSHEAIQIPWFPNSKLSLSRGVAIETEFTTLRSTSTCFFCSGVECSTVSDANSLRNTTHSNYSTAVRVTCVEGFAFNPQDFTTNSVDTVCTSNGTWSPVPETCQRK